MRSGLGLVWVWSGCGDVFVVYGAGCNGSVTLYYGHIGAFYGFMVYSGLNGCMWLNGAYTLSDDVSHCRHGVGCGVWCCLVWLCGLLCGCSGSFLGLGVLWSGSGAVWLSVAVLVALVVCCLGCYNDFMIL